MADQRHQILKSKANSVTAVGTTTTALASNPDRAGWHIQNVGTSTLYVYMGASASTTTFHTVLKGGTADEDGTGELYSQMDGAIYTGTVTVYSINPKWVVLEL